MLQRAWWSAIDVLRLPNRLDGEVEAPPLLLENCALGRQDRLEILRPRSQEPFDVAEGDADELQRDDLLENRDVFRNVDSILRRRTSWLEQAEPVVMMKRPHTDARQRGELVDPIGPHRIRFHPLYQR